MTKKPALTLLIPVAPDPSGSIQDIRDPTAAPFRWTCRLSVRFDSGGGTGFGSGILITPSIVLTAAHNLFQLDIRSGRLVTAEKFIVAFNFGTTSEVSRLSDAKEGAGGNWIVSPLWKRALAKIHGRPRDPKKGPHNIAETKDHQFDFGIIKLPAQITKVTSKDEFGHWGKSGTDSLVDPDTSVAVVGEAQRHKIKPFIHTAGYPFSPHEGLKLVLASRSGGKIIKLRNSLIEYPSDILRFIDNMEKKTMTVADLQGMSGGPIFINEGFRDSLKRDRSVVWRLVGVHNSKGHGLILSDRVHKQVKHMISQL